MTNKSEDISVCLLKISRCPEAMTTKTDRGWESAVNYKRDRASQTATRQTRRRDRGNTDLQAMEEAMDCSRHL